MQIAGNCFYSKENNGSPYKKTRKNWKFFRANGPNELWQIDIKRPFLLDGERVKALVILDDHSRFLLSARLLKSITTNVVTQELNHCIERYSEPNAILSDNGSQFREIFEKWCMHHPFIRNVKEKSNDVSGILMRNISDWRRCFEDPQTPCRRIPRMV